MRRRAVTAVLAAAIPLAAGAPAGAATTVVTGALAPEAEFSAAGGTAMIREDGAGVWHGSVRAHGLPEGEYVWGIREPTDFDGDGQPDFAPFYAACSFTVTPGGAGGCAGTPYHQASLAAGQVVELYRQTPSGGGFALTLAARGILR